MIIITNIICLCQIKVGLEETKKDLDIYFLASQIQ